MKRIKEVVKDPESFEQIKCDKTTVMHYLAGADPYSGMPTPLRPAPPHKFVKHVLKHAPEELLNKKNYYGRTPLVVAATAGYYKLVRSLIARGAKAGEINPIIASLLSKVYFDPSFRIPAILLKAGYSISKPSEKPLTAIIHDVSDSLDLSERSMNPLYNDVSRMMELHFNNLPAKVRWLLENGAKEENENALVIKKCLFIMASSQLKDQILRPVLSVLCEYSHPDLLCEENESLLIKLVYQHCEEALQHLLKHQSLNSEKLYNVARLHMNTSLMSLLDPKKDPLEVLSKTEPSFYGNTLHQLPLAFNRGHYKREFPFEFKTRLASLTKLASPNPFEKKIIELYLPTEEGTPMARALLYGNIGEIRNLINRGWNVFIEEDFIYQSIQEGTRSYGVEDVLSRMLSHKEWRALWLNQLISEFNKESHTGVTLSNEFDRALVEILNKRLSADYVLSLFDNGLNPETYKGSYSLGRKISDFYYSSFDDDRGFHAYGGYKELLILYKEARCRGWL